MTPCNDPHIFFWNAVESWLRSGLQGKPEQIDLACQLIGAMRDGLLLEDTPFEALERQLEALNQRTHGVSSAGEVAEIIEATGEPLLERLNEITMGGCGLDLVRGLLANFAAQSAAHSASDTDKSLEPSTAVDLDLDSLFVDEPENAIHQLMTEMLMESGLGVEGSSPAALAMNVPAEPESWSEAEEAPAEESQTLAALLGASKIEAEEPQEQEALPVVAEAAETNDEAEAAEPRQLEETAPALHDVEEKQSTVESFGITPREPIAEVIHAPLTPAPFAMVEPATPAAPAASTTEPPSPAQVPPAEQNVATSEPLSATTAPLSPAAEATDIEREWLVGSDAYQIVQALAVRIKEAIGRLRNNPRDASVLRALKGLGVEVDSGVRRLGYRMFSSLGHSMGQLLDNLLESPVSPPAEIFTVLDSYHHCLEDVLEGRVSKNKTYYFLINEISRVEEAVRIAIEDATEEDALQTELEDEAQEPVRGQAEKPARGSDGANENAPGEGRASRLSSLQEVFLVEAGEHIDALTRNLLLIEKEPDNQEIIFALMRSAHSLKGSAAIARFSRISSLGHAMEDLLVVFRDHTLHVSPEAINLLLNGVDQLQMLIQSAEEGAEEADSRIIALSEAFRATAAAILENVEAYRSKAPTAIVVQPTVAAAPEASTARAEVVKFVRVDIHQLDSLMNLAADMVINRTRLFTQLEQQQTDIHFFAECRRRMKLLSNRLGSLVLATRGQAVPALAEAQASARGASGSLLRGLPLIGSTFSRSGQQILDDFADGEFDRFSELDLIARDLRDLATLFDDLGESMTSLTGGMEQNIAQVSLVANDLHQSLMKTRMVPIGQIFNRFPRVVRDISRELGKQINLNLSGEETLLDKNIIEEITDPLIHLVRNAVDHGIESVAERESLEKQATGNIWLSARQSGNQVLIEVRDDGHGINPEQVRREAVRRGFISAERAAEYSDQELQGLLLLPGFSTAERVTDLSGRGVGLDVANQAIKELNGSLHISSEYGEGTTIAIRLPITLAINQALLFRSSGHAFAIPLSSVDELISLNEARIFTSGGRPAMLLRGQIVPLCSFDSIVGLPRLEEDEQTRQIVLINDGVNRGGMIVDSLIGREEIVVKSLGAHLKRVRFFSAATILGDGSVTLIVDPEHVLRASAEAGALGTFTPMPAALPAAAPREVQPATPRAAATPVEGRAPRTAPAEQRAETRVPHPPTPSPATRSGRKRILVTDDSISIRRFVSGILNAAGYEVETACDGVEALEKLERQTFNLVLTDLEMPRMHGYELITEIKASPTQRNLPIVILTSRSGEKHSRKGLELGASAFIVKPFEENQLLNQISALLS